MTDDSPDAIATAQAALSSVWDILQAQHAETADLRERLAAAEQAADRLHAVQEELQYANDAATAAAGQIQSLTEAVRSLQEELSLEKRKVVQRQQAVQGALGADTAPVRLAEAPAEPATPDAPAPIDPLAHAFLEWCHSGALNSRLDLFTPFLRERLEGAHVRAVHRDADSAARPVVLTEAAGGSSAVVYWAVSHDGRHRLLPQPMGPHQFRELAPCFTGDATPAALDAVVPGDVDLSPGGFVLATPGHVC